MKNFINERPMDTWILDKIEQGDPPSFLNAIKTKLDERKSIREKIERYQLERIKTTIYFAKENSPFYRNHLRKIDENKITSMNDIQNIPFIDESDCDEKLLCVSQGQISRVVTVPSYTMPNNLISLKTSGSTGKPKRVYFTEEDQELTIDFFHNGMKNLIGSEDRLLILMPCSTPTSIGDLLRIGVERMGAKVYAIGPLQKKGKWQEIITLIEKEKITSIVATPTQIEEMTREISKEKEIKLKTMLLSAEYVSDVLTKKANSLFGCKVFEHYGSTEMGLGGAVSCHMVEGYHPREADLYFEIIDPMTGELVEDGKWGEVVFTTLTRKGMPFIRYRTGDISRWIKEPCKCGSYLKRLDKVKDRKEKKGMNFYN